MSDGTSDSVDSQPQVHSETPPPESQSESHIPSFENDEDNNPFSHTQGLTSMIEDSMIERQKTSDLNQDDEELEESILLYKNGKSSNEGESNEHGSANGKSSETENDKYNRIQINYESRVTKLLKPQSKVRVQITEAGNSNEGVSNSSKKYIVYTIKLISVDNPNEEDVQTRRRYSDFESLRDILTKIFPLVIVPPIPPKNYFNLNVLNGLVNGATSQHANGATLSSSGETDNKTSPSTTSTKHPNGDGSSQASSNYYTYINSNHLNKHKLVEHRKRLLTNFLNNCLEIPKLRNLEFFAKFLDPNANWTDEISLISSQLPKSVYQSNPENGLQTDPIYSNLPLPVSSHSIPSFLKPLKKKVGAVGAAAAAAATSSTSTHTSQSAGQTSGEEDQQLNQDLSASVEEPSIAGSPSENSVDSQILDSTQLDETNRKIMENFIGLSNDYTELGSIFNSFSFILSETSASDKFKNTSSSDDIKINLVFDKIGQVFDRSYITLNSLISDLETKFSEPLGETVRYSGTLQTIKKFKERKFRQSRLLDRDVEDKKKEYNNLIVAEEEANRIENSGGNGLAKNGKYDLKMMQNTPNSTSSARGGGYRMFPMIKKITRYVSDIIDQNPEETRKQKVVSLRTKIDILEKCQSRMLEDISYISDELNNNFKSFHKIQLKMIYDILLTYNGFLIDWAKKNIEIWEEIREEIVKL